jgi:isochorismate hydrolase
MVSKIVQELGYCESAPVHYECHDYRKKAYGSKPYPRYIDSGLSIPKGYLEPKPGDNVALLIVDMEDKGLRYLLDEDRARLIENQADILDNYCRPLDLPVVEIVHGRGAKTTGKIQTLIKNVPRHECLERDTDNGFTNLELNRILKEWHIDIPIVSGINTHRCILTTVEGGTDFDYRMATSMDLISKPNRSNDRRSLEKLRKISYFSESYKDILPLFFLEE